MFDINLAVELANICSISYKSLFDMDILFYRVREGYLRYQPFFINNIEAYLVEYEKYYVIVFRGSDHVDDWKTNFNIKEHKSEMGCLHKGFYDAYKPLWDELSPFVKYLAIKDKPLYLTGHSMGGALATVMATHLEVIAKYDYEAVYTFGQPKVFCEESSYTKRASKKIYRIYNPFDVVAYLPPLFTRYRHIGRSLHLDLNGDII